MTGMTGMTEMTEMTNADGRLAVDDADGVRTMTLNRPEKRNALDSELLRALEAAIGAAADDTTCRLVVIRGRGPAFSAGADLRDRAPGADGEWAERRWAMGGWQRLLDQLERLRQPTVAVLHGPVVGGAALLALSCDLRLGDDTTVWTIPELAIGIPLTWAGIPRLVREIGVARARELVMTGRPVGADEATRLGLQHRTAARGQAFDEMVEETISSVLAMPDGALHATKAAFTAVGQQVGGHALFWSDPDLLGYAMGMEETSTHAASYLDRKAAERAARDRD